MWVVVVCNLGFRNRVDVGSGKRRCVYRRIIGSNKT